MKRILLTSIIVFFAIILNLGFVQAQVTIETKPSPPNFKLPLPQKPGLDYQLIPGHWIWHRPTKMYAWIGPHWIPRKENKKWSPGRWEKRAKGWKWIPGRWEKIRRKRYFFK